MNASRDISRNQSLSVSNNTSQVIESSRPSHQRGKSTDIKTMISELQLLQKASQLSENTLKEPLSPIFRNVE